jgi:hypothetical protein
MAFCGNCGTKAVGAFCVSCGSRTELAAQPIEPIAPKVEPLPAPVEIEVVEQLIEAEHSDQPEVSQVATRGPKKPKPLLWVAGAIVAMAALFFPGFGELTVVYHDNTTAENPAVALTLKVADRTIRITKDSEGKAIYTGTWSTFQSEELKVIPDPKNDEEVTIAMPQFGSLGIWNLNRQRVVTITANDRNLEVNLTGGDNFSQVGTLEAYRTFYSSELASCKEDFNDDFGYGIKLRQNANQNYLAFVKDSLLDGQRTLYYPIWAARADNLQSKMSDYLSLITDNSLPTGDPVLSSNGVEVQAAFIDLRAAWEGLEAVARSESDSRWSAAWDKIYESESALTSKVNQFNPNASGAAGKSCSARLNRD